MLGFFLPKTSRYGATLFTLSIVKCYGDVATLTWPRKRDVFPEQGEGVVKEIQILEETRSERTWKTTTTSEVSCRYSALDIQLVCIKTWKVSVAGARSCAGRPDYWCIKYSVTSRVKHTPACQSMALPKRKSDILSALCSTRVRSCRSV
jgi:hypothetical protein